MNSLAEVSYVSKGGAPSDGLAWTTAFTDQQDGLTDATSGDRIRVASGMYSSGAPAGAGFTISEMYAWRCTLHPQILPNARPSPYPDGIVTPSFASSASEPSGGQSSTILPFTTRYSLSCDPEASLSPFVIWYVCRATT